MKRILLTLDSDPRVRKQQFVADTVGYRLTEASIEHTGLCKPMRNIGFGALEFELTLPNDADVTSALRIIQAVARNAYATGLIRYAEWDVPL